MKIIALAQVYNEELFLDKAFSWIYPLVDEIVISEGRLTPFGNLPSKSTDGTRDIIQKWFIHDYGDSKKIKIVDAEEGVANNREDAEGNNKNNLLENSSAEHGDLIFIWDCDEFWHSGNFLSIVEQFKSDDSIVHVPVEEWQFAYDLNYAFKAEHNGRFMRYVNGAHFTTTNHFIHPGLGDVTKDYSRLAKREETAMHHLCWVKDPFLIKQKVQSFNRPSFTNWFNHVYLQWPFDPNKAYQNNSRIAPYFGKGFAEGQHTILEYPNIDLPPVLNNFNIDWTEKIKQNYRELVI